jgi:hypothetical protein
MFSVIYTFYVKPGAENDFVKAWSALTELFKVHAGSGGSRLHKASNGNYVAYAQWPDRQTWEQAAEKLPVEAGPIREKMRKSCRSIGTQFELDTIVDFIPK